MTIKILGGLANGRSLFVPGGDQTRPTSVRLRRRIFDSYQDLSDFDFIDLCAGSGAVGFEAWSRGAKSVQFIETHRLARQAIQKNIANFCDYFPEETKERPLELLRSKAQQWRPGAQSEQSIVFFDPPYQEKALYKQVVMPLLQDRTVAELWLESDRQKGLPKEYWSENGHEPDKIFEQGTSYIAIFRFS